MSGKEKFNHCPQCHGFLQTAENARRSFCNHCRFPLMLIANKYRLVERLGEGSTATIYLAHHVNLIEDKERVIKVIKSETLSDETARLRFQREIQVTIALSRRNEHIVNIYDDFGEEPHLGHYYIMEYLQGKPLQDMMFAGEPLGNWLTFRIFFQLCKAMGAAHRAGIVHRDLKPENILLVERDLEPYFLKLIDFGIAKPLRRKLDLVVTHGALGTPSYMSPEQCLNRPVDGRSDIYAMGALLYELLTGYQPFVDPEDDDSEEGLSRKSMLYLLEAHVKHKPRPMREAFPDLKIPEGLDRVVLRTLEKDPELRYQRVEDFWAALSAFAPPAYQQLELASQTALPALQHFTTSSAGLPGDLAIPGLSSTAESDGQVVEGEPKELAVEKPLEEDVMPRFLHAESYPSLDALTSVSAPPSSLEERLATFRSSSQLPAVTESPSSQQLPAASGSHDALPATLSNDDVAPPVASTSPPRFAVATTRTPRPPSRSPRIQREQGVQEIFLSPSSDALPALQTFVVPGEKESEIEERASMPAALQGPAISPESSSEIPTAPSSLVPANAETPESVEVTDASEETPDDDVDTTPLTPPDEEPSTTDEPGTSVSLSDEDDAPVAAHTEDAITQDAPLPEGVKEAAQQLLATLKDEATQSNADDAPSSAKSTAPQADDSVTQAKDTIGSAIADAIASSSSLPAVDAPKEEEAPLPDSAEERAPLRLERRKKTLRRKALLASQATVEQSFFSPEQLAALARVDVDDEDEYEDDELPELEVSADIDAEPTSPAIPAPLMSDASEDAKIPEEQAAQGSAQETLPTTEGEDKVDSISQPPHSQASWFKAPK